MKASFIWGSGQVMQKPDMLGKIALALGCGLLACGPAWGQEQEAPDLEGGPVLDGGPPPLRVPPPKPAPRPAPKPAPKPEPRAAAPAKPAGPSADQLKAEEARLARQAQEQKAEALRLKRVADDLAAREAGLKVRESDLAAKERSFAAQSLDQQADIDRQLADVKRQREGLERQLAELTAERDALARERDDLARQLADATRGSKALARADAKDEAPPIRRDARPGPRPRYSDLDIELARRACMQAGMDEAQARNFYSAWYDGTPDVEHGRSLVLRGVMRLEGRRGYSLVDTVCEVDGAGEELRFAFLR